MDMRATLDTLIVANEIETVCFPGLWMPYHIGGTPEELVNKWGSRTYEHLERVCDSSGDEAGVQRCLKYHLDSTTIPSPLPAWRSVVRDFRELSDADIADLALQGDTVWQHGWVFSTLIADPTCYLPWMSEQVDAAGGVNTVTQKITNLSELPASQYRAVFNCTGTPICSFSVTGVMCGALSFVVQL